MTTGDLPPCVVTSRPWDGGSVGSTSEEVRRQMDLRDVLEEGSFGGDYRVSSWAGVAGTRQM